MLNLLLMEGYNKKYSLNISLKLQCDKKNI